ncbi:MAG: hypothetical protein ABIE70_08435 [bacterium]
MDQLERENIRRRLQKLVNQPVNDPGIKAITVNPLYHGSSRMRVTVGSVCANLEPGAPPQEVLAIFESMSFLVVTAVRGATSGLPYIFTRQEVKNVEKG